MTRFAESRLNAGSALIISILILFVLTALGLALTLTSITETDISANYKWGEMAFFNAEAGLEYGKSVLGSFVADGGDFVKALPPARLSEDQMNEPPEEGTGRDYKYSVSQGGITIYIGKVLTSLNGARRFENVAGDLDGVGLRELQGTVTIWVRRPVVGRLDYDKNDQVIVTAEGTAPNFEPSGSARAAVRRLEMAMRFAGNAKGLEYTGPTTGSEHEGTTTDTYGDRKGIPPP